MFAMRALNKSALLSRSFTHVVFAGGGNRCWWQAGLIEQLSQHPCWQARRLIGASAGAGIATAFSTGRLQSSLAAAVERFNATPTNVEWRRLLRGKRPFMLPLIYPDWIASYLDAADLARLKAARLRVDVVITRPIPLLPLPLSTLLALTLYSTEKFWLKHFHSRLPHHIGFRAEYLDLAHSADLETARTLLLASAAAVPLTPTHKVGNRAALDGGFYDSVPLPREQGVEATTLVLLTRHRPDLPQIFEHQQRVYLQPRARVAAINMDCTSGENVLLTYEQGKREGMALLA
ncbi:MAG: patatin-like phospholipase family protein [Burkholderiaceae bacterium]|nr:patatin-like phospholipase family protein [Burkholderiaceae bacterium]